MACVVTRQVVTESCRPAPRSRLNVSPALRQSEHEHENHRRSRNRNGRRSHPPRVDQNHAAALSARARRAAALFSPRAFGGPSGARRNPAPSAKSRRPCGGGARIARPRPHNRALGCSWRGAASTLTRRPHPPSPFPHRSPCATLPAGVDAPTRRRACASRGRWVTRIRRAPSLALGVFAKSHGP